MEMADGTGRWKEVIVSRGVREGGGTTSHQVRCMRKERRRKMYRKHPTVRKIFGLVHGWQMENKC